MEPKALQKQLQGISAITLTAFDENQEVDLPAMKRHLRFFVDNGITKKNGVIVVTGSTGECGALCAGSRARIWDAALEEIGDDLPVIAGVNHSNLFEVIEMTKQAEKAGVAGIMAVSPYYYPPREDVVLDFYTRLSESTPLGIMLYNNTEVTHFDIPVATLSKIADLENIVGIKECTPTFAKMEQSARFLSSKLTVINGHGEFLEPMAAIAGTTGFISSTANFAPRIAVSMWEARTAGDYAKAKTLRDNLAPYLDLAGKLGAAGGEPKVLALLKYLAAKVGSPVGLGRNPVLPLSAAEQQAADAALQSIDLG